MRKAFLALLILPLIQASGMQATIQATPNTVGATSTLSLMLKLDSAVGVPADGGIRLKVPSSFGTQIQCTIIDPLTLTLKQDSTTGQRCHLLSSTEVQLSIASGSLPPAATVFLQITDFNNPSSTVANQGFIISTFDSTGVTTSSLNGLSIAALQPGVLSASLAAMTDGIGLVSPDTALIINLSTAIDLPCNSTSQGCSLNLLLPFLEPSQTGVQQPVVDSALVKCEISKNLSAYSAIACSITADSLAPSGKSLKVNQLTSTHLPKGVPITLRVWGFRNPIDLNPMTGFVAKTMDGSGGLIEISSSLKLSVTQPSIIRDAAATLESGSTQVLGISTVRLDFSSPVPLSSGCIIQVAVPTDFGNLRLSLTAVKAYGMFGFIRSLPFSVNDQYITVTDACPSYMPNSSQASLRLEGLQNPSMVKNTDTFKIVITDSQGGMLATTQAPIIVSATSFTPGSFVSAALKLSNPTVQEASALYVNILPSNKLSQDARVLFSFTPEFSLNATSPVVVSSLKSIDVINVECIANQTSNRIVVRNMFYSFGYSPKVDGALIFNLTGIISKNPTTTLPNGKIKIQTFDLISAATSTAAALFGLVDETQIVTDGMLSPGTMKTFNFTTSSDTANTFPTNATISLILNHAVNSNSSLYIQLPADFGVAQLSTKCMDATGFASIMPDCSVSYQPDGTTLVSVNGLKSLAAGSSVSVKLTSIRMPRYQGKLDGQISAVTGTGTSLVDKSAIDFYILKAATFSSLSVTQGSVICSEQTNLSFNITKPPTFVIAPSDSLALTLPVGFAFESPSCKLNGGSITCTYDAAKRILKLFSIGDLTAYLIEITGLRNAFSIKPASALSVALVDDRQRLLMSVPPTLNATVVTQVAAPLQNLKLLQTTTDPGIAADYSIQFSTTHQLPSVAYVSIELPTCMLFNSITATSFDQTFVQLKSSVTLSTISIELPLLSGQQLAGFVLKGIVNPTEDCLATGGIRMKLFEDSANLYLMATGSVTPSLSCTGLCSGCLSAQKDFCTACKSGYALIAESGICSEVCPAGSLFDSVGKQCTKCNSTCQTCVGNADFCSSCADPVFVTTESGSCIRKADCSAIIGNYVDDTSKSCKKCEYPCTACTKNACLACSSQTYLFEGDCIESCPIGTLTMVNNSTNKCLGEPRTLVLQKLVTDVPLAYLVVFMFFVAAIIKVTCMRDMSLLVTLVIISNLFETISLLELIIYAQQSKAEALQMHESERGLFKYTPLGALGIVLLLNVYVVASHCHSLKPEKEATNEDKEEYDKWAIDQVLKRLLIYTISSICSFHNINWFNYTGLFPDSLKMRLIRHKFVSFYTSISRLSMIIPRLLMLTYCVYYGVINASGRLNTNTELGNDFVAKLTEHAFLNVLSVFLLFLALNFSWYDNPAEIIKQHELHKQAQNLQSPSTPQQDFQKETPKLYVPKSSIELHMMKSAKSRKSLFVGNVRMNSSVFDSTAQPIKVSVDSMAFRFNDSRAIDTSSQVNIITTSQPIIPQNANAPEKPMVKQEKSEQEEINFDFLEEMKRSVLTKRERRGRLKYANNASDGKAITKQSLDCSERTIKTQRCKPKSFVIRDDEDPENPRQRVCIEAVEKVSNVTQTVESMEPSEAVVQAKSLLKPMTSGKESTSTARTKLESFLKDFDSDIMGPSLSLQSPASIGISPQPNKMKSKFATNIK